MIRFASLLASIYECIGDVSIVSPPAMLSRIPGPAIVRKYIAYIDKLLLFPLSLLLLARSFDIVHIADHSNSFYTFCFPRRKSIVTCHDLLAVRGAMGDKAAFCEASPIGIWLQRLIMVGLQRAGALIFDSQATYTDFQRLIGNVPGLRHAVIPIPLNSPFTSNTQAYCLSAAEEAQVPNQAFLLMVGSSIPRKNRALAIRLLDSLGTNSPYLLVFAGAPLTPEEYAFQCTHSLGSRPISIPSPSHALLNQLYCRAHALLFPSFAEGFGWPLVEAQTCRCPVIASRTTSIPEVAGDGALYADPTDIATFAQHVVALENPTVRDKLINLGVVNTHRFQPELVFEAYRRFVFQS